MAFSAKTDYSGLTTIFDTELAVRDANENIAAKSTYEPEGENGALLGIEAYGDNSSPSNNFALKGTLTADAGEIQLGKVITIGTSPNQKKFALKSLKINTAANSPVKISAACDQLEPGATDVATNNFDVPAFTLTTKHVAQILMNAFTVSGTGANLMSVDYDFSLKVNTDTLVGAIISSGVSGAKVTISGSILVKGDVVPEVAPVAASGFVVTQTPTCNNPETAYKTYNFALAKELTLHTAQVVG